MSSDDKSLPEEIKEVKAERRPTLLIVMFLILSLAGQYFFKLGMDQPASKELVASIIQSCASVLDGSVSGIFYAAWSCVCLMFRPIILIGLAAYAFSAVCWLSVLSKVELSFAYPLISLGYVVILLMGWLCFGEQVSWLRWMGVFLISFGIVAVYAEKFFVKWGSLAALTMFVSALLVLYFADNASAWKLEAEMPVALIALTIPMGIIGQILFKAGMGKDCNKERISVIAQSVKSIKETPWASSLKAGLKSAEMCFSPLIFLGFAVYLLSTVLWLILLTKVPLSFLYPLLSFGYVLVLLIGKFGFKEDVTFMRWYGVILICFGITFIYSEVMICTYKVCTALVLNIMGFVILTAAMRTRIKNFFAPHPEKDNK